MIWNKLIKVLIYSSLFIALYLIFGNLGLFVGLLVYFIEG